MTQQRIPKPALAIGYWLASSRLGSAFSKFASPRLDRLIFKLTKARTTGSAFFLGLPVITVTCIGAKSGQPRTVNLLGIIDPADAQRVALITSNWGQEHEPAWYYNMKANPKVQGTMNGITRSYIAAEATGEDYTRLWNAAVSTYVGYSAYKKRIASTRPIPVILLMPTTD